MQIAVPISKALNALYLLSRVYKRMLPKLCGHYSYTKTVTLQFNRITRLFSQFQAESCVTSHQ